MYFSFICYLALALLLCSAIDAYRIGTGISDITGPVTQVMLMGYAVLGQTGQGILQRLWSRAFIIEDKDKNRIVFVNTDTQSMGDIVKKRVVQELQRQLGSKLYTEKNVMLSSTHSHSGMGGYLQYTLYEFASLGWIEETVRPMVDGIIQSIMKAHDHLEEGSITLSQGELLDTNINRSPQSYLMNPKEERSQYKYDVDKTMTTLSFNNKAGDDIGLISWFAVHGVSVNNTNKLINGDNKGYAAYLAEKMMNGQDVLSGQGKFVAAFAQSNEGDVSPNTLGAYCTGTDIPCDGTRDLKCPNGSSCVGRGPGWKTSDLESNRIIGQNQAHRALELHHARSSTPLEGKVGFVQRYWDITKTIIIDQHGKYTRPCSPAMGYAFAAGTTDGPALGGFYQNTTQGTFGWNLIKNMIKKPTRKQKECQAPKPILLDTGEIEILHPWQPEILDIQLFRIGNAFIYAVPAEFTTMSGRRLKNSIKKALIKHKLGNQDTVVIHSGPANGYASYCTTYEEYQHQRYEGASTPYGPHTLQAYMKAFNELVFMMANPNNHSFVSEDLPDYTERGFNLSPMYRSDQPHLFRSFGDILKDVSSTYYSVHLMPSPFVVSAIFVASNPRNDPMLGQTFLTVEKKVGNTWKVIRTDDDYDTRFIWRYKSQVLGMSEATIEWHVPNNVEPGIYRLGYRGNNRPPFSKKLIPHQGYSSEFEISNLY
ncbi:Neutral/alkaline nonlysosomal ceramidase [Gilbertella persicaria]|uniref:Neutral/alkaline nonlysosomal ceramidase n=1 Tax=Gilbertella persicaria TaxID=101096 RepID=UPI00221EEE13|nr:Neutral/alkaline nonlysosomal ceramidase [Gilbertella persicaria]KAI8053674.1 Neutral/alkaline nonlysosomal ceramidase [Gilbertella persicaria]